jgi:predicted nucleic acid-binding protein
MAAERLFLDTCLLTAASVPAHPAHVAARAYFQRARRRGSSFCISPQVCREFLVVITRQPVEGIVYTLEDADRALMSGARSATSCRRGSDTVKQWIQLARRHGVQGKSLHDCNIAAVMLTHGVERLATRNPADFKRYPIHVDAVKP